MLALATLYVLVTAASASERFPAVDDRPLRLTLKPFAFAAGGAGPVVPPETRNVPDASSNWALRTPGRFLVPGAEVLVFDAGVNVFDRVVLAGSWAQVDWNDFVANLKSVPRFDNDDIFINYLGHPYMGSVAFNAARGLGLSFWQALPYEIASGVIWEYIGEDVLKPSINDFVESAVGGPMIGEAFHRMARLLLVGDDVPWGVRELTATILDPAGTLNYELFGPPAKLIPPDLTPWHARLYAGGLALSDGIVRGQGLFGLDMVYGFGVPDSTGCVNPFDFFDLHADFGFTQPFTADAWLHGVVAGCHLGPKLPGTWGLFGLLDFATGPGFRVASTALGPGIQVEAHPTSLLRVRAQAVGAGATMAASGSVAQTDDFGDMGTQLCPYSMGPGVLAEADAELEIREVSSVRAMWRSWWIAAMTPVAGWERQDVMTIEATAQLPARMFVGAAGSFQRRLPARVNDPAQAGWTARLIAGFRLGSEPGP